MTSAKSIPSVSVNYAQTGRTIRSNELGMRPMQERAWEKRGEQYLLIKSPPASGKSRALMFIALDKLANQGLRQAVIVVPEKTIGASFEDVALSRFGLQIIGRATRDAPGADDQQAVTDIDYQRAESEAVSESDEVDLEFHGSNPTSQGDFKKSLYVRSAYRHDPSFRGTTIQERPPGGGWHGRAHAQPPRCRSRHPKRGGRSHLRPRAPERRRRSGGRAATVRQPAT